MIDCARASDGASDAIEVSVVAFQDGDLWVAQCVEYDIAARAETLPKLPRAPERALAANASINAERGRNGLDGIPEAPPRFKRLFETSTLGIEDLKAATSTEPIRIRTLRVAEVV